MDDWLAGRWEDCWKNACSIEQRRKTQKSKDNKLTVNMEQINTRKRIEED